MELRNSYYYNITQKLIDHSSELESYYHLDMITHVEKKLFSLDYGLIFLLFVYVVIGINYLNIIYCVLYIMKYVNFNIGTSYTFEGSCERRKIKRSDWNIYLRGNINNMINMIGLNQWNIINNIILLHFQFLFH